MRTHWIDYLRVAAIVAVINIHVSSPFYYRYGQIRTLDWWVANIINGASRFAVPLFVMISGCLLLGKEFDTRYFYGKRARRLIPPLLFWSAVYLAFRLYHGDDLQSILTYDLLAKGRVYIHLWYLNMLLGLTLIVPFINRALLRMKPSPVQAGLLLLAFTMLLGWNQFGAVTAGRPLETQWFGVLPWYAGYFAAGYLLDACHDGLRVGTRLAAGIVVLAAAAGIGLNYAACHTFGVISDDFILSDTGPMVFLITAGIFLLARRNRHLFKESPLIRALSGASYGIYLLHPLVIYTVQNYFASYFQHGLLFMPLTFALTLAISFCLIYAMRKLRFGRFLC